MLSFPLTDEGKARVEAIVATITNSYFGKEIYVTAEEKVVAYIYFLIKDHPFTDGNKRTSCLVFEALCDLNDLKPNYSIASLDAIAVFIEKIQEQDHQAVIKSLADLLFENSSNS